MRKVIFQAKRLQVLANYLRTVPNRRFDMDTWADNKFCGKSRPSESQHTTCKTSACALGWACTIPQFNKAGLKFGVNRNMWNYSNENVPAFKRRKGEYAGAKFFGLTAHESYVLFLGDQVTPKMKAREIEELIATHE